MTKVICQYLDQPVQIMDRGGGGYWGMAHADWPGLGLAKGRLGPRDCVHRGRCSLKQAEVPLAKELGGRRQRESSCTPPRERLWWPPQVHGVGGNAVCPSQRRLLASSSSLPPAHSGCWARSLAGGPGGVGGQPARQPVCAPSFSMATAGPDACSSQQPLGSLCRMVRPHPAS